MGRTTQTNVAVATATMAGVHNLFEG